MYDLGRQMGQRFRMWKEELKNHVYSPVGTVSFCYCVTTGHPTPAEAEKMPLSPCPPGTRWGGMWEYGWFFGDAALPDGCEGRRVVLFPGVGGEQLIYVNGKAAGSVDKGHPYVTLTRSGKAGETYHLQIESYAGHGPRLETLGPCPPERPAIPPVTGPQCTVEEAVLAVWNEDAYQLLLDVEALDSLQQILPDGSLRALRAEEKRVDFITRVSWHERRKLLKVHFESNILCEEAVHEIQFGYVKRPCHRSHPFARDRFEVSNHRYSALCEGNRGFALLNDGLYGLSTGRGEMALTLLRAPLAPDDTCDRGDHAFVYSLMPFAGPLRDSGVMRAGYELNMPVDALPGSCEKQAGPWCGGAIVAEHIKPAEDGRGMILRLYESMGETARDTLHLPEEKNVFLSSLDEASEAFLCRGREIPLALRPFEIKTLRLTD